MIKIPEDLTVSSVDAKVAPYIVSEDLRRAIKYATILERPLLLRGDPGCGKTRFAEVLAYNIYADEYKDHYFEWFIKSTSKAKDGLYTFDHLKRLRDASIGRDQDLSESNYVKRGPLGKAFEASKKEEPAILLIDEIDKAEIDFPNCKLPILSTT